MTFRYRVIGKASNVFAIYKINFIMDSNLDSDKDPVAVHGQAYRKAGENFGHGLIFTIHSIEKI